ncbi:MAG: hypothetical protein E7137_03420 [Rikenellaceae bacterium]|nr:hypothetical protein [Rikenellaceae bacterium]
MKGIAPPPSPALKRKIPKVATKSKSGKAPLTGKKGKNLKIEMFLGENFGQEEFYPYICGLKSVKTFITN